MSDLKSDCSAAFTNNPDITGVGVRVSFYLQTFLLVILVDRSWQEAPSALWTFIVTSFGLTIASIVQAKSDQLSLLQALQVSNLVWLSNFATFVALASYSRQKAANRKMRKKVRASDYHVKYAAMLQTLLSMVLTLYMWSTAERLGPDWALVCSSRIFYVYFVIKAPALGSGRVAGLTASGFLTMAYILITAHELVASYRKQKSKERKRQTSLPTTVQDTKSLPILSYPVASIPRSTISDQQDSGSSRMSVPPVYTHAQHKEHRRRPKRRKWSSDLDPMLVGIIICHVMVFTYFIVSTELLLWYNPDADNSAKAWGFGQILALIVVIPSALSVMDALSEHGLKRLSPRNKGRSSSWHGHKVKYVKEVTVQGRR